MPRFACEVQALIAVTDVRVWPPAGATQTAGMCANAESISAKPGRQDRAGVREK